MNDIYYKDTNTSLEKYIEPTAKWWTMHGDFLSCALDETRRPNFPRHGIIESLPQKKQN